MVRSRSWCRSPRVVHPAEIRREEAADDEIVQAVDMLPTKRGVASARLRSLSFVMAPRRLEAIQIARAMSRCSMSAWTTSVCNALIRGASRNARALLGKSVPGLSGACQPEVQGVILKTPPMSSAPPVSVTP
jgi:hypothetical protein